MDIFIFLKLIVTSICYFVESPDLNSIENLWHELKEYLRKHVKPRREADLVQGIISFWRTVTVEKCIKVYKSRKNSYTVRDKSKRRCDGILIATNTDPS